MKKIFIALVCCVALVGCKSDVGCVEGDCENGKGVYKDSKGNSYVGEYKDGLPNGKGVSTLIDGTIYDGEWFGGLMEGKGIKTWSNGTKYVGEWNGHKKNGQGTEYYSDGTIFHKGLWKDGEPIRTAKEEYKKIVVDYDLVGRWKATWTGPKNIYELYEKERKYKLVRFLMNYEPEIFDFIKKGDKYCDVKFDCTDYFKIVEGNLQYWNDAIGGHQKNTTYMIID